MNGRLRIIPANDHVALDMAERARAHGEPSLLKFLARGLSRVHSALYIGVSPSKFDEMVKDGRMPHAKRVDGRRVWDKRRLDEAFEALPDENAEAGDGWEHLNGGHAPQAR